MKKISLLLLLLLFTSTAFAAVVGYVDYDYIYENYSKSKEYTTKINAKAKEIKDYVQETQKQINKVTELDTKNKTIVDRKAGLEKLKKEYSSLIAQQEKLVRTKVKKAGETVRIQKELEIIVNKKTWVTGGVDCTADILKAIE